MKFNFSLSFLFALFILASCGSPENTGNFQTTEFKVLGNCDMCKKRIESSVKDVKGVNSAEWDVDKKMIKVQHDSLTSINDLHLKIAAAGHDTEIQTAKDEAYKSLHVCCQYKRK